MQSPRFKASQRVFKRIAAGVTVAAGLRITSEIGLKNPCRADRQKVFVGNRLGHNPAALNERLWIITGTDSLPVRIAGWRETVAEPCQALLPQ